MKTLISCSKAFVSLAVLIGGMTVGHSDVLTIKLSPPGSSPAVGLSPANEVPAVTNSTGSGGEILGGITFDTATLTLNFAVGYGSEFGFTDLTGPATGVNLHGPAGVAAVAPVLFDLSGFHVTAPDPASGGFIFGAVTYTATDASNLLTGLNYLDIPTALNPDGEIRAQLIVATNAVPTNTAPTLECPAPVTLDCGSSNSGPVDLVARVSDAEGDGLTVIWTVDGMELQTNSVPAGPPGATNDVHFIAQFGSGTHPVDLWVSDGQAPPVTCSTTVTVEDTTPPEIESITATPNVLWPPNHSFVRVRVNVVATDACGPVTSRIVSITSNEPENGVGDGNTARDWKIVGDLKARLRAERSGKGNGRVYTIEVQATDDAGNSSTGYVTVTVPHSRGRR